MLRNWEITEFIFCYSTNQSVKQPNYKSHKKDLAPAPSSFFFQFLYNLKIKFLYTVLMWESFLACIFLFWLLLYLKKDFEGLTDAFPL